MVVTNMQKNTKSIIVATWVGIIVNILLTIIKTVGGIVSGSRALIADALHSASDIVGSIVILFAVKISVKPADAEHPYRHGKAENIASIIIALLLLAVGIEISISSVNVFFGEKPVAPGMLALIVIILSILIKEALFHYKYRLGKKYQTTAFISECMDYGSDSLTSVSV